MGLNIRHSDHIDRDVKLGLFSGYRGGLAAGCLKDSWSDRARLGLRGGQFEGSKVPGFLPETKGHALAAQPQSLDYLMVSLHVLITEVPELTTSLAYEL